MPGGENRVAMKGSKRSTAFGPVENESAHVLGLPATKKRVVLGDLTNSNTCSTQNTSLRQTQKPKAKQKPGSKKEDDGDESVDPGFYEEDFTPENSQRSAYAPLIYQHLHSMEAEAKRRPLANYMEKVQNDLTPNMRFVLVDWLVEVAEEYRLVADTLYLAVSHIDRFLSFHTLNRKKLQLLGVSSMLVASKYEEIHPPHVEDFVYITDNTFTKEEVVLMEGELLKFLDFEIGNPTTKTFLSYLAELSLLDYYCVRFLPSLIAAAAIFLARLIILPTLHPWSIALQQYTGYRPYDLKDCVLAIHEMLFSKSEASMVGDKYQDHKYKQVAKMSPPSEIAAQYFQDV
nr:G2/mitotic-specific cyclin C13-1-like [Ipomoea batatas]